MLRVFAAALAALLFAASAAAQAQDKLQEKLKVTATFSILGDVVKTSAATASR